MGGWSIGVVMEKKNKESLPPGLTADPDRARHQRMQHVAFLPHSSTASIHPLQCSNTPFLLCSISPHSNTLLTSMRDEAISRAL